ncbi:AGAP008654-PA-like protein [Anopheles sinensis]|uniref:AGAP008654-PA-like protein n=1 Tax=Anopheles sinensis TaxID=74873 RepID=A0A084VSM8_ANOSI|nr:AGAP008654-PA-like protein [Anopheles sinensis]
MLQLNASFIDGEECYSGARVRRQIRSPQGGAEVVLFTEIPVEHRPRVLIQMSHPVYTPGDYVKYRILLTDGLTKPLDKSTGSLPVTIALRHTTQHTVGSWVVQLDPGAVYNGQYLLTDDRDLGDWNLTATVDGQTTTKPFEVRHYSAPVHQISVEVDRMDMDKLKLNINANYIFGKPMQGTMTVTISGGDVPFSPIQKPISEQGKVMLLIPMEQIFDLGEDEFPAPPDVRVITVTVTVETSNGISSRTYHHTKPITVHPDNHQLTLHRMVGFDPEQNATLLVKLTPLSKNTILVDRQVTVSTQLWDEDENMILREDTFTRTVEKDGTAVLSVPTTDATTSVIFAVEYKALKSSFTVESSYNPELYVRILPAEVRASLTLGIASSHRLDGYVVVVRNHTGEVLDRIVIHESDSQESYFEYDLRRTGGLKNVHLFAKVNDGDRLVQTSISHEEPRLPSKSSISLEETNKSHEITVNTLSNLGVVGIAVYEGLLDWGNIDQINRYMMFNGSLYATPDEFFAEYANQVFITPSVKPDPSEPRSQLSEQPSTKFNQLLLWQHNASADPKFEFKIPAHVSQLTVTAFTFSSTTGLDVPVPIYWERNDVIKIHIHAPYSARKLEPVMVDVYVVNNRDRRINFLLVELQNTANEFQFLNNSGRIDAVKKTVFGSLEAMEVQRVEFLIKPKKLGPIVLKAIAYTLDDVFAMDETVLRTVPESELKTETIMRPFSIQGSVMKVSEKLSIPPMVDQGTEKITLELRHEQNQMATLPASLLLDPLVQADPFTMAVKASLTLDVLRMGEIHWPELDAEANAMVADSLDKMKGLVKPDGSFEIEGYRPGSFAACWGTIVAAKALTFAQPHSRDVKDSSGKALMDALAWLKGRQANDGHFCGGEVLDTEQRVEVTSQALLAFSSTGKHSWQYQTVINNARGYLRSTVTVLNDPYHLALVAYAMQYSARIKTGMETDAYLSETVNYALEALWVHKKTSPSQNFVWWDSPSNRSLEATSYTLLMLTSKKLLLESAPLVNWIKRQSYRRMPPVVTPDSHVALRALMSYAEHTTFLHQEYTAVVVAKDRSREIYNATLQRYSATHVLTLPPTTRSVSFTINGTITGTMQIIYSYMENVAQHRSRFNLQIVRYDESDMDYVYWGICVRFQPRRSLERTRMVTCEFSFPSGYIALDDSVEELQGLDEIVSVTTRNKETVLAVTFEEITVQGRCFNVTGFRRKRLDKVLPGELKVFDVTDPCKCWILLLCFAQN